MEGAKQIVQGLRSRPIKPTEQEIFNAVREYIHVILLKLIFQEKSAHSLSFMGGTCLRICHQLKRYSEDLDFALDDADPRYDFNTLMDEVTHNLSLRGFEMGCKVKSGKVVQKAFVRFSGLSGSLGLKTFGPDQKLHVKVEVDTHPPPLRKDDRETFFINRFNEIFPILKHTLPTLFAGKLLAILSRPFDRGRDYYDLIWYLSQKIPVNMDYLNGGLKKLEFKNQTEVFRALDIKISKIKTANILKDVEHLIEDPTEIAWMQQFPKVYRQLADAYSLSC